MQDDAAAKRRSLSSGELIGGGSGIIGTLRFATARCCYGYEKSNLLPVTSAHALQFGFPAVACFSTRAKYFVWRRPQYVSINFHFHAIFMIISLFSEVKFKD